MSQGSNYTGVLRHMGSELGRGVNVRYPRMGCPCRRQKLTNAEAMTLVRAESPQRPKRGSGRQQKARKSLDFSSTQGHHHTPHLPFFPWMHDPILV
jgi:hypothetical protein